MNNDTSDKICFSVHADSLTIIESPPGGVSRDKPFNPADMLIETAPMVTFHSAPPLMVGPDQPPVAPASK